MKADVHALKRACPMPVLLHRMGLGEFAKSSCRSPFREDKKPSWGIFKRHGQCFFKDQATGDTGDEITLLARWKGLDEKCDFPAILKLYAELAGVGPNQDNGGPRAAGSAPKNGNSVSWSTCVAAFTPARAEELATWRGYSPEFCTWLRTENVIGLRGDNWALPVHGDAGAVVACHYRVDRGSVEKPDWFYNPKGFGARPLVLADPKEAAIGFVFESPWDAFAVMDKIGWHKPKGIPQTCIVSTRGAGNGKLAGGLFGPEATVYAFKQNDETKNGRNSADDWLADVCAHAGCKVFRVTTPAPHKDMNDWTRGGASKEDIDAAIRAAKPVDVQQPIAAPERQPGATDSCSLLNDERPKVRLPGDNYLLSDAAKAVGEILSKKDIFSRGGLVFTLDRNGDRLILMTPDILRTWIEDHLFLFRVREVRDAEELIQIKRTISETDAKGVLASPQFQKCLRPIERLNPIRLPVMENGIIRLLPRGYDAETKSFTFHPINMDDIPASEGKRIIDELLSEFNFADAGRSLAVAVAGMITVFGIGLLPRKSLRPCFIYMANAEGAGKTLLVKCATVPVLGYAPTGTKPKDEDEMRKTLHTAVLEARPVIFFDNVKKHLTSEALEGFLTAQTYEARVLGVSKSFRGENNAVVFVSGNGCTVSPDMRRRSLFCELFLEAERAEDRVFQHDLEVPALTERRAEIVSALWALIQDWNRANRPTPSRGNSSFPEWSNIIGGIVQHAGYGCALETPQIESAADTDGADMRVLVKSIAAGSNLNQVTFEEIANAARADGLFARIITDGQDLDARGKATLAALLKRYDRRLIGGYRFTLLGKGRGRRFQVEEISK
jgi:hypothetical protein